jgi:indolepyruvate ferredoxin oxidoreductase beta subunit
MNLVIAGLGAQRVLLSRDIICRALAKHGEEIISTHTYDMAQRGASVEAFIRINEGHFPRVMPGECHLLLAFEAIEALRHINLLNSNTAILLNRCVIPPPMDRAVWDLSKILSILQEVTKKIKSLPASEIAQELGMTDQTNIIMIGFLCSFNLIPATQSDFISAVSETIRKSELADAKKALQVGFEYCGKRRV